MRARKQLELLPLSPFWLKIYSFLLSLSLVFPLRFSSVPFPGISFLIQTCWNVLGRGGGSGGKRERKETGGEKLRNRLVITSEHLEKRMWFQFTWPHSFSPPWLPFGHSNTPFASRLLAASFTAFVWGMWRRAQKEQNEMKWSRLEQSERKREWMELIKGN